MLGAQMACASHLILRPRRLCNLGLLVVYRLRVGGRGHGGRSDISYFTIGEGPHRLWVDYNEYGFISAGRGMQWGEAISVFRESNIFAAHLKGKGFVGIGRITARAFPMRDVKIKNRPLIDHELGLRSARIWAITSTRMNHLNSLL